MNPISETRRELWRYTWPAIISGLAVPLLGLVDTAIIGRVGDSNALGAVALGSWLFDLLYWGFGFIRMGTTGLVSHVLITKFVEVVLRIVENS